MDILAIVLLISIFIEGIFSICGAVFMAFPLFVKIIFIVLGVASLILTGYFFALRKMFKIFKE